MAAMNTTPGHKYILCTEKKKYMQHLKRGLWGNLQLGGSCRKGTSVLKD